MQLCMNFALVFRVYFYEPFRRIYMKIDPSQKPLPINAPKTLQPAGEPEGKSEFARVLGESMQQKPIAPVDKTRFVPSVKAPDVKVPDHAQSLEWRTADRLLDALESYRNQLKDPNSNLRMVAPYVGRLKSILDEAQPVIDQLRSDNPVKDVLLQTMVHISKEIERFNMGYYMDEPLDMAAVQKPL
jgi:hypothetical protein